MPKIHRRKWSENVCFIKINRLGGGGLISPLSNFILHMSFWANCQFTPKTSKNVLFDFGISDPVRRPDQPSVGPWAYGWFLRRKPTLEDRPALDAPPHPQGRAAGHTLFHHAPQQVALLGRGPFHVRVREEGVDLPDLRQPWRWAAFVDEAGRGMPLSVAGQGGP